MEGRCWRLCCCTAVTSEEALCTCATLQEQKCTQIQSLGFLQGRVAFQHTCARAHVHTDTHSHTCTHTFTHARTHLWFTAPPSFLRLALWLRLDSNVKMKNSLLRAALFALCAGTPPLRQPTRPPAPPTAPPPPPTHPPPLPTRPPRPREFCSLPVISSSVVPGPPPAANGGSLRL